MLVSRFSASEAAQRWLDRFSGADRETAAAILDEMLLVSANEFNHGVTRLLNQVFGARENNRPLALYAEREVERENNDILPIFANSHQGRAVGEGPRPIPFDPDRPEVGSEGILANLITSYCRSHGKDALNHPGPDLLRKKRAGPIVIVADFIGSGQRVWKMLEAFRTVATIRSWRSYHLIEFYVVAYSGTERGIHRVQASGLRPTVLTVAGCPTINSAFRGPARNSVYQLCRSHPPGHRDPLGYGQLGVLIAFEHGVPNNAPPILHSGWGKWTPLFHRRSTVEASSEFPATNREEIAARAERLLCIRNATAYLSDSRGSRWIETMLVLAAIESGARTIPAISAQTRIKLETVRDTLEFTEIARWTTKAIRLSQLGRAELQRLRKRRARTPVLPKPDKPYYYPTQLRAR